VAPSGIAAVLNEAMPRYCRSLASSPARIAVAVVDVLFEVLPVPEVSLDSRT